MNLSCRAGLIRADRTRVVARSTVWGVAGAALLLSFYFGILIWAQGIGHTLEQFSQDRLYILPIVVGFGLQVALYAYLRALLRRNSRMGGSGSSTALVATSTGTSTVSMIACCIHHLGDILPLMGLSAAGLFLAEYRIPSLIVAMASNLIGIVAMSRAIGKVRMSTGQA
ncbi:MAG: hypothetical protein HPY71_06830 [Firmicutes bacterium]|nr:hypothetical protein [Bacillota bacterium]